MVLGLLVVLDVYDRIVILLCVVFVIFSLLFVFFFLVLSEIYLFFWLVIINLVNVLYFLIFLNLIVNGFSVIIVLILLCVIWYCKFLVFSILEYGMIVIFNFKVVIYNLYVVIDCGIIMSILLFLDKLCDVKILFILLDCLMSCW